jgi:pyridoxamine 5'-phosphate oxidase family protein
MVEFSEAEIAFLKEQEVGRLATVSRHSIPQITPVLYVLDSGNLYFATDYGTKKLDNMKLNNKVALVVDSYARQPRGITVQGSAKIIENGKEFVRIEKLLEERHSYYKANPFKENEAPIIIIEPARKVSWGL